MPAARGPNARRGEMIVVGLVGKIGAGKSTVARRLAEHGAEVIDADRIARAVLDEPDARDEIVARFGPEVIGADGRVHRDSLASRVFGPTPAHAEALDALEAIVHPRVRARIEAALAAARSREAAGGVPIVMVLDIPLLVQAGWAAECDRLIHVECEDAERRRRLAARNLTAAEQEARDAAWQRRFRPEQVPPFKTDTVDASGDLAYTLHHVDRVWQTLVRPASPG